MIDRICSLIGRYIGSEFIESRGYLIRAANAALDYESSLNLGHMRYCQQSLISALMRVPYHHRLAADEQITPIIESVELLLASRRKVEKAYV